MKNEKWLITRWDVLDEAIKLSIKLRRGRANKYGGFIESKWGEWWFYDNEFRFWREIGNTNFLALEYLKKLKMEKENETNTIKI